MHLGCHRLRPATPARVSDLPGGVVEPLRKRVSCSTKPKVAYDLTWEGLFDIVQNSRTSCAQQPGDPGCAALPQLGAWSSCIVVGGSPSIRRLARRDRSQGIRPVGEPGTGGPPTTLQACGGCMCRWPSTTAVVLIIQKPDGFRSRKLHPDLARPDGHVEQLGWRSALRHPHPDQGIDQEVSTPDGAGLHFDVESKLAVPTHVSGGYEVTRTGHMACGRAKFVERRTYDMTDQAIIARGRLRRHRPSVAPLCRTTATSQCRAGSV